LNCVLSLQAEVARELSLEHGMTYIEASSLDGTNVKEVLLTAVGEIMEVRRGGDGLS
jgi:hypothetical protein